jgi:hypothetical protein
MENFYFNSNVKLKFNKSKDKKKTVKLRKITKVEDL